MSDPLSDSLESSDSSATSPAASSPAASAPAYGHLRRDYQLDRLDTGDVARDPLDQFAAWFEQVQTCPDGSPIPDWLELNAMTLSTAGPSGEVSGRVLLLKGIAHGQMLFYTNYASTKGRHLAENPRASLCFFWPHWQRQVRVAGHVEKIDRARSEAYFHSRPRASQLGAHVSEQSAEIASRQMMQQRMQALSQRYPEGTAIPLPEHWGGYALMPQRMEFWQGRASRLHDRIVYHREGDEFRISRIAP